MTNSYYENNGTSVIDVLEQMGIAKDFCIGNIVKYIKRSDIKDDKSIAFKKAKDYYEYLRSCKYYMPIIDKAIESACSILDCNDKRIDFYVYMK